MNRRTDMETIEMFERRIGWTWVAGLAVLLVVTAAQATTHPKKTVAESLVELYVPMQEALAGDSVAGVREQVAKIGAAAAAIAGAKGEPALSAAVEVVATAARGMTATDIEGLRGQFKPLSRGLALLVEKQAVAGRGIYYCPMVDAYWIQKSGEVRNPYFGKQMLTCGELVTKVGEG